jgi:hypothetical protein
VSLVKLTDDFVRVAAPIGHGRGDQDLDVVAAQQWKELSIFDSSLEHELHRHHDQRHVTMPGLPLARLIVSHADMALGVLKGAFDPEALRLHLRKLIHARLFIGVTQTVFDRGRRIDLTTHHQMPPVCGRTVLVPEPHLSMDHLDAQISARRVAQRLRAATPAPRALTRGSGDGVASQKSHLGAPTGAHAGSSLAARTSSDSLIEAGTRVGTVNAIAAF